MPVLGLVTCEVLEDEWALLLAADPAVDRIVVIDDSHSRRFIRALDERGCTHVERIPHIAAFRAEPSDGITVIIRLLEFALHRSRTVLRGALTEAVQEMSRYTDAIVLGYGLCGNTLDHPEAILMGKQPLFMPMDCDHPVDDCVGLLMGGRERYYAEQCRVPGTFFMTPGWTRHWRRLLDGPGAKGTTGEKTLLSRVFERYHRCLLIRTPVMREEVMRDNCREFASLLGLQMEECSGSTALLERTWSAARDSLRTR